ncbi:UNVERIFIED_CONTAM: hypothetical protein GTU68_054500 [Idotea baltica]|nr:hypothetical protein [Idotea baltica]
MAVEISERRMCFAFSANRLESPFSSSMF